MQGRDQLGGVTLDLRRDAAAVSLDEIHDEEVWLEQLDGGDRQRRMAGELAEHVSLKAKINSCRCLPRLHGEPPPVGEIDFEARQSKADRHRRKRRHPRAERRLQPLLHPQRVHGIR